MQNFHTQFNFMYNSQKHIQGDGEDGEFKKHVLFVNTP